MIRYHSQKQQSLAEFDWPFQTALDENNRWVKLSECVPWDELAEGYYQGLADTQGRPTKDARLVIGAVIIKHKLCLSDRETVAQIQENPYLQYFVGLPGYQMEAPFVPSLLVEVRKRMGKTVFDVFEAAIINSVESARAGKTKTSVKKTDQDDDEPPSVSDGGSPEEAPEHQGKNGYRLNYIRAKRADTSFAWINSIFLVMNLQILLRIFFALWNSGVSLVPSWLLAVVQTLFRPREIPYVSDRISGQSMPAC
jgi:hypothetical protein